VRHRDKGPSLRVGEAAASLKEADLLKKGDIQMHLSNCSLLSQARSTLLVDRCEVHLQQYTPDIDIGCLDLHTTLLIDTATMPG
jgi:hypothetical protein